MPRAAERGNSHTIPFRITRLISPAVLGARLRRVYPKIPFVYPVCSSIDKGLPVNRSAYNAGRSDPAGPSKLEGFLSWTGERAIQRAP